MVRRELWGCPGLFFRCSDRNDCAFVNGTSPVVTKARVLAYPTEPLPYLAQGPDWAANTSTRPDPQESRPQGISSTISKLPNLMLIPWRSPSRPLVKLEMFRNAETKQAALTDHFTGRFTSERPARLCFRIRSRAASSSAYQEKHGWQFHHRGVLTNHSALDLMAVDFPEHCFSGICTPLPRQCGNLLSLKLSWRALRYGEI